MPSETTPATISGEEILSVSALNRLARQTLEKRFPLLWVSGEISNLRRPASGHVYFALKDEGAQVDCVMFRTRSQLLPFRLQDGQRVEARALVTLYEARGGFQLSVEALRQAGIGAMFEAFARLREKLEKEGLFAPERRLPLPRFPRRIGIVTSLQAAALRDVLAALARRARHLPVVIYPAPVQGEGAASGIAGAIRAAAARGECDLLIIARGGGGIEDLWAFNEEIVARAIDACPIPIVSGIGHETDATIADLAADCRAATPTAAAELASAGWFEAQAELRRLASALRHHLQRRLQERMQQVDLLARRLIHPGERLGRLRAETAHLASRLGSCLRQQIVACRSDMQGLDARLALCRPDIRHARRDIDELAGRLRAAIAVGLMQRTHRLQSLAASLGHLSPQSVLARGYSLVRKPDGSIVRSCAQLGVGERLRLSFSEGGAEARVTQCDSLNI
ncbi:MAG: Exodeoxyribonuclease 7 large subunit [Rhodocyclaceae bacterium]|nr:MAG: exodeoxyribonuclease VII large subunit [Rhodocyclaceae bacterium]MBE7422630.1 exodeoxyribonuclease VII large subunit [Zoogloeaceae bacterium]MBV6407382.1 Exodeoxyribonuclease 7 large subunit [Rhodocyclaceae bacterium]MCK6383779.1 exodeoxyribonuclease VII large subunit [Rhodocyclaceae bacterium]